MNFCVYKTSSGCDKNNFTSLNSMSNIVARQGNSYTFCHFLLQSSVVQEDNSHNSFNPNQHQYDVDPITSSLAKTGAIANGFLHDSQLAIPSVSYLIHCKIFEV